MRAFPLNFLQLEVTAQCNLRCTHCYNESDAHSSYRNRLGLDEYKKVASDAFDLGCRSVQIIGGEPAMWPNVAELLIYLKNKGFSQIEYYSNFTILPPKVVEALKEVKAQIAFTLMSADPAVHDKITGKAGSWDATISNVKSLLRSNKARAAVNIFDHTEESASETVQFLKSLGIEDVKVDRVRGVGRGREGGNPARRSVVDLAPELCGACVKGAAYIAATGDVHFCGFSREVSLGNISESPIQNILDSDLFLSSHALLEGEFKKGDFTKACNPSARCNPEANYCPPGGCGPVRVDNNPAPGRSIHEEVDA